MKKYILNKIKNHINKNFYKQTFPLNALADMVSKQMCKKYLYKAILTAAFVVSEE